MRALRARPRVLLTRCARRRVSTRSCYARSLPSASRRLGAVKMRGSMHCSTVVGDASREGASAEARAASLTAATRAAAQRPSLPQPARRCATVRLDRAYAIDWRQVHHNQSPAHGARPCGCFAASSAAISGDLRKSGNPEIRKWRRRAAAVGPQRDLELGAGRRVRPGSRSHSKASTVGKKCDIYGQTKARRR